MDLEGSHNPDHLRVTTSQQEVLLKEYEMGVTICRHEVTLRRDGLLFFVTAQGAIMAILFGQTSPSGAAAIGLCLFAIFVSLLTVINDVRLLSHYREYVSRLKTIEQDLGMKLYSKHKEDAQAPWWVLPTAPFFEGLPLLAIGFWICYLCCS
jgi:hypothetical protein